MAGEREAEEASERELKAEVRMPRVVTGGCLTEAEVRANEEAGGEARGEEL